MQDIERRYNLLDKYFDLSTAKGSSTGREDYIKANKAIPEKAFIESTHWVLFLKNEFCKLDSSQLAQSFFCLDGFKEHYPISLFIEILVGLLKENLSNTDSKDLKFVEKKLVLMSWIICWKKNSFSKEQILAEIGIKEFFYWDWIDLLFKTDVTKEDFSKEIIDHVLLQKEVTPDLIIRLSSWGKIDEKMMFTIINDIIEKADFNTQALTQWKNKRYG